MKSLFQMFCIAAIALATSVSGFAQSNTTQSPPASQKEQTVEQAYLNASGETIIIKELAESSSREMKLLALEYAGKAIAAGRSNPLIVDTLVQLAYEPIITPVYTAGLGKPINDFADVQAKACNLLGSTTDQKSIDALLVVLQYAEEPIVLASALRSLGKIGKNPDNSVTIAMSYLLNRYDLMRPDNNIAFEYLVAIGGFLKQGNLKDRSAFSSVVKILDGNYVYPVKVMAQKIRDQLLNS